MDDVITLACQEAAAGRTILARQVFEYEGPAWQLAAALATMSDVAVVDVGYDLRANGFV